MRTIRTKVYKFSELNEQAKQKAIEKFSIINVDYEWWESTYDDAERAGLKITGFDIDRANYCNGEFITSALEVSAKIVQEHGQNCETYKDAVLFGIEYDTLVGKYSDGIDTTKVTYENEFDFDNEADELETEFLKTICEDYKIILSKEYDYLTSKDAIIETIEANSYEFKVDGTIF